jgi:putative transposase
MTNHIHLLAVPSTEDGLQRVLKPLHMRYAQKINRERGWKGHFWQGRYLSSPLDGEYLLFTTRYIERNPIRVKKVRKAENYKWSSARGHCGTAQDDILTKKMKWLNKYEGIDNWRQWLSIKEEKEKTDLIRRNTEKGIPTGSARFIRRLEKLADRVLDYRPIGRPRKQN